MKVLEKRRMQVLIVEDNKADARMARALIEETGFPINIILIGDGEGATRIRESAAKGEAPVPDLILLDVNLPGKNGHEVLASIRGSGRLASVCVAMCSGSSSIEDKAMARSNQANAYLQKPMGAEEMNAMVSSLCRILVSLNDGSESFVSF
jgi:two-component system, chemotaxis family, response regulator Rcp1